MNGGSGEGSIGSVPDGGFSRIQSAQLGVRRATPLAISSGLFGILYGAACMSLGISPTLAALSCILVFSGAVQFTVLGMLAEPFSTSAVAVSSLLICNRLFLMGISIAKHIGARRWVARLLSMTVLSDGAWAATIAEKAPVDRFVYFVSAGIWILVLWVSGTLLGAVIAGQLEPQTIAALRFSGVLFLALLLLLVVKNTSIGHAPWIASALVSLAVSRLVPLPLAFLIGVTVGSCIAWFGAAKEQTDVG
jgi:predicted branched-subunit amino acid permease